MILLLGGTSETAHLAEAIACAGHRVLVSTATGIALATGLHPCIAHRQGRLDAEQMAALVRERGVQAIVDATHPYAAAVRATAEAVAAHAGIPYLSYVRPGSVGEGTDVWLAADHEEAARLACESGRPILLTIGSRNVLPYAAAARQAGVLLIARILDHSESHESCRAAGIPQEHIITGRGPFGVAENRSIIQKYKIGVLVTKDSGIAGGVLEKLEAARLEGCQVIVVGRPEQACGGFDNVEALLSTLNQCVPPQEEDPQRPVLALDLESVLAPEIWETVACMADVPDLALTTRDLPDYDALMRQRLLLCREHGLTFARLLTVVAGMAPLPGALDFLTWARQHFHVVILSDTFLELAAPLLEKLGSPMMLCNALTLGGDGYIAGYQLRAASGKAGAVAHFRRLGLRVAAVGDSFNDLAMLHASDAAFLFRPAPRVVEAGVAFRPFWSFDELQTALTAFL